MITHAKSNHSLSPSGVDAAAAISKKDGLAQRAEADVKIYLSYSINREPIACLLRDIMTDVAAKVALHFNQMDVSLRPAGTVIVPLIMHSKSAFWTLNRLGSRLGLFTSVSFHCGRVGRHVCRLICQLMRTSSAKVMYVKARVRYRAQTAKKLSWLLSNKIKKEKKEIGKRAKTDGEKRWAELRRGMIKKQNFKINLWSRASKRELWDRIIEKQKTGEKIKGQKQSGASEI